MQVGNKMLALEEKYGSLEKNHKSLEQDILGLQETQNKSLSAITSTGVYFSAFSVMPDVSRT